MRKNGHMTSKKEKRSLTKRDITILLIGLAFGLWMVGSGLWTAFMGGADTAEEVLAQVNPTEVTQALLALPVTPEQERPAYNRDEFGARWADVDHNGCDTRNDILGRDLREVTYKEGTRDCVVLTGVLDDPYTGSTIDFQRGQGTSEAVQIDHVVALANAWNSGAWQWDLTQRQEFANDPLNLLAVDGPTNGAKSASSADKWLPPVKDYHCDYAARQVAVKNTWELSVTESERTALAKALVSCGAQVLPNE